MVTLLEKYNAMLDALKDIDLRITQARLASNIGRKKDRTTFLLAEMDRIQTVTIAAITKAEGV